MSGRANNHSAYWAFLVHRGSGLVLAMFLPVHLYVLALALDGPANLDRFLNWTDTPLLKLSEAGLVIVLAAHMAGGLRLLAVEFLPWSESQKTYIALGAAVAMGAGILFGLQAF